MSEVKMNFTQVEGNRQWKIQTHVRGKVDGLKRKGQKQLDFQITTMMIAICLPNVNSSVPGGCHIVHLGGNAVLLSDSLNCHHYTKPLNESPHTKDTTSNACYALQFCLQQNQRKQLLCMKLIIFGIIENTKLPNKEIQIHEIQIQTEMQKQ